MASYPSSIVTLATHNDGDTIPASDVNTPNAEIVAVETGLLNGFQHVLKPLTDNTYDLGDSTHAWKNLYTKGTVQLGGVIYTFPAADGSNGQFLQTNGSKVLSWANAVVDINAFRLTLTSGSPYTTSDVTAATTLYLSPINGNRITVQDGSGNKTVLSSAEVSIAIPATTSQMYDVFAYSNSGVLTLELLAWTNDTTRATAIARSNGQLTKSGDTTRLYVGSVRTTTVAGQTEDSVSNRFVWNYYNRGERLLSKAEATASWTYVTTATIRQVRAQTTNQVAFIIGVQEVLLDASYFSIAQTSDASLRAIKIGLGLDSTTAFSTTQSGNTLVTTTSLQIGTTAVLKSYPAVGYHYLAMLEAGDAAVTVTYYGTGTYVGASTMLARIIG